MELDRLVSQVLNSRLKSSIRLLIEVFFSRPAWKLTIVLCSLFATFFGLLGPFFQKEFVDHLNDSGDQTLHYLFYSFGALFLSLGFNVLTNYLGMREALKMQRVLAQRIYNHTLSLRMDSLSGRPVGEMVSLYATDVPGATVFLEQSLPVGASIFFPLVLAPWALIVYFDVPLAPLLSVMSGIILLSFMMAYRQSRFFFQFKKLAADRIGLVNEWIQNIRTLRILGWIESFEMKIFKVRQIETLNRISMVTNGQAMNAISSSVSFLLNITAVSSIVFFSEKEVSTGTLLALLWIVGVFLTRPFRQLPWFFTFVFDSWTSLRRIDAFLSLRNEDRHSRPSEFQKLQSDDSSSPALAIQNLDLKIGGRHLLKSVNLEVRRGEFVSIVGEVGSGKSLLLLSLLGETGASFDSFRILGNNALRMPLDQLRQFFTFVPQEGFIMSSSLRENVAFEYGSSGKHSDENILQALKSAQFELTKERIEAGLETEIGERGVNLSGGQKQRVSLARVDFFKAPIILLDDCLSAVDVDTENRLIQDLINSSWRDRTRLLVTHRLTVLEKSDRVVFLKDGAIAAQGKFQELLATNPDFREFASTVAHDQSSRTLPFPGKAEEDPVPPVPMESQEPES